MKNSNKILIGGAALVALGSSRSTKDTDYLICDEGDSRTFIHDTEDVDYINAAASEFFGKIWANEVGNEIASPQSLLELKAYAFVQHCLNFNFQKANEAEFDMKFLVLEFGLSEVKIVNGFVSAGELHEVNKVIKAAKRN